jgi:hypothetical protein
MSYMRSETKQVDSSGNATAFCSGGAASNPDWY